MSKSANRPFVFHPVAHPERLGHFVTEIEINFAERRLGLINESEDCRRGYFLPRQVNLEGAGIQQRKKRVGNQALLKLWQGVLEVVEEEEAEGYLAARNLAGKNFIISVPRLYPYMDFYGALDRTPPSVSLPPEIVAKGEAYLRGEGCPLDAPLVCFHYRQPGYIQQLYSGLGVDDYERSQYDYRNVNSQPYDQAVRWLAEQGYVVIRMGKESQPWERPHPSTIDYGASAHDEELDLYLFSKCEFYFAGSNSGIYGYAELFRKPILFTNFYPFKHVYNFSPRYLTIFQRPVEGATGKVIPVGEVLFTKGAEEIHQSSFTRDWQLKQNSAEEILDATQEMVARLRGTWRETRSDQVRQGRFMHLLHESRKFPQTSWGGRIGARFLQRIEEEEGIPLTYTRATT